MKIFKIPVAAKVRRLKLQGIWRLLTSAITVLKQPPEFTILNLAP
jgi:hypothetical protein